MTQWYSKTGHRIHKPIQNYLNTYDTFLLLNDDSHFRKVSYKCFLSLGKKYKKLEDNLTWLQDLIKNEHLIQSDYYDLSLEKFEFRDIEPSDKMISYIEKVLKNYKVNLLSWAEKYALNFDKQVSKWPIGHKTKTSYQGIYDYDYNSKNNPFNIDIIYGQVSHAPFLKGKKKMLEYLVKIMYATQIEEIDDATKKVWIQEINDMKI